MNYAIMRVAKIKTIAQVASIGHHMERTRQTRNADDQRRQLNERLAGSGDWAADLQARLATVETVRKNAVLAHEYVLTASPEFFAAGTSEEQARRLAAWRDASMAWLRETYGADNVVAAVLHRDESTPHIQAIAVPIDERGRLNARAFTGGRERLVALQDSYHVAVAHLGLERGVRGSVAEHQEVKRFYEQLRAPVPEVTREIAAAVQIEPPGHMVSRPHEYAKQQQDRVLVDVAPKVEELARAKEYLARKLAQQERQLAAQAERQRQYRAIADHVRQLDLKTVITHLGGERDRHDRAKYHLSGEAISINGTKFYNHHQQRGGGGAIDLVMHATGHSYKEAVAYLRDHLGGDVAVAAGAQHAQRIVQETPAVAFRAPEPVAERWEQVRTYLTERRSLSPDLVDALHHKGGLYADRRSNAVFPRYDAQGQATGASLRGTAPESTFTGLAAGTRRTEGWFHFTVPGHPGADKPPLLIIAESPIDALSYYELYRRGQRDERWGRITVASTDGAGPVPQVGQQEIVRTLNAGGQVRVATDNDTAGDGMWKHICRLVRHGSDQSDGLSVRERLHDALEGPRPSEEALQRRYHLNPDGLIRARPPLKDWNDVLREPARAAAALKEQNWLAFYLSQSRADAGIPRGGDRAKQVRQDAEDTERWRAYVSRHLEVLGDRAEIAREAAKTDRAKLMKHVPSGRDREDRR